MNRRISIVDVAREAGVHHSTVSRALRKHSAIPEATRKRIRLIANKLGYIPDPTMAALSAYKNTLRSPGFLANLAWVTNFPTRDGWKNNPHFLGNFAGAKERAAELGYGIEPIWLREGFPQGKSFSKVLKNQGIQGLLFCAQATPKTSLDLSWDFFSSVSFGYALAEPKLHFVAADHFRSIRHLLKNLQSLGYRHPLLFLSPPLDSRVDFGWSAGFATGLRELFLSPCEPIYLRNPDPEELIRTVEKEKPDVILCPRSWANQIETHLQHAGWRIPEDLGLAVINNCQEDVEWGGILELDEQLGRNGMDMLSAMLLRGEKGVPDHAKHQMTEGEFRIGRTLRKVERG